MNLQTRMSPEITARAGADCSVDLGPSRIAARAALLCMATVLAIAAAAATGCSAVDKDATTVDRWTDEAVLCSAEPTSVTYGAYRMTAGVFAADEGALRVVCRCDEAAVYDRTNTTTDWEARRVIDDGEGSTYTLDDAAVAAVAHTMTFGVGLPAQAAVEQEKIARNEAMEENAVERLQAGEDFVIVPWEGPVRSHQATYTRRERDVHESSMEPETRRAAVAAVGTEIIAVDTRGRRVAHGRTDSAGVAVLHLGRTLFELERLAAGNYDIQLLHDSQAESVGTVTVTPGALAKCLAAARERSLAATGPLRGRPRAVVSIRGPQGAVAAGGEFEVEVAVRNDGTGPLYRLTAILASDATWLASSPLEFGRLEPGETRVLRGSVSVPAQETGGAHVLEVQFDEQNSRVPADESMVLHVAALQRPKFVATWIVFDDGSGASRGNGDGRLQAGETVDIEITVRNVGGGRAAATDIRLENDLGGSFALLIDGADLGTIPPGESRSARLTIEVPADGAPGLLRPELVVRDALLDVHGRQRLTLRVDAGSG